MEELKIIQLLNGELGAVFLCLFCVPIVLRLLYLVRRSAGFAKRVNLCVTIIFLGTTVWAAHLTFIRTYTAAETEQFDLYRVASMLVLTVSGTAISGWIAQAHKSLFVHIVCGGIFGLTTSATLIYGLSTSLLSYSLLMSSLDALALAVTGFIFGAMASALFRLSAFNSSWSAGSLLVVGVVLLPQVLVQTMTLAPSSSRSAPQLLGIEADFLVVLGFASLAVCLSWALAAFVAESQEDNIRDATLQDASLHDPLTKLPNRLHLEQRFGELRKKGSSKDSLSIAVIVFNVKGFKTINERHGSGFADFVLQELARRLAKLSGSLFFPSRAAADEFVVVVINPKDRNAVMDLASQARAELCHPIAQSHVLINPELYVGFALLPEDDVCVDGVLLKAEAALLVAKNSLGNPIRGYDPEVQRQGEQRGLLLQELQEAVARGEMELRYQMQNDIDTEDLVGFEVLLRWTSPTLGPIAPSVFIPLAEESGLIKSIGLWVLEEACKEAATWHRKYSIAVNVSPQQLLDPTFLDSVNGVLETTNFPANRLELEITESSIIEDETNSMAIMHQLRAMGIRIAMDDFGTGYSSLAMLQKFPFDKIKIDRSFVMDVHENPERAAIIEATVLIGEAMSIPILVEGVEQRSELTFLRRARCNIIQGFILGEPLRLEDVRELAVIPDEYRRLWY